jgi:DNA-binding MarR family transcriptional regulator
VPDPAWLTPGEREAWLALLSTITLLPGAIEAPLQREANVSLFDYNVLAMLSESNSRALPMSELAARTSASLSRLSHVVKKLEQRGLVGRASHTDDARVTTASITEKGYALILRLAPLHVAAVRAAIFDQLDERDVQDLARVGRRLVGGLDRQHWILRTPAP